MTHLALQTSLAFIDGIGFDPFFRGLLSVLTGVVVLMGGTYLVVATNTGTRLGFLVSMGALFGWMFLMGIVWTIYGIGWAGHAPTWDLVEINVDDAEDTDDGLLYAESEGSADLVQGASGGIPAGGLGSASIDAGAVLDRIDDPDARSTAQTLLAEAGTVGDIADPDVAQNAALVASREVDTGDWRYLVASDATRGEAQASADAYLVEQGGFEVGGYLPTQFGAFLVDGKPTLKENANLWDRVVHTLDETILNPFYDQELIVIQVQETVHQATLPGQPPPVATIDPDKPLVSVIMERNRGGPIPALFSGLRFTPAMFTVFTGLVFAALAWNMHIRDQREAKVRAAA